MRIFGGAFVASALFVFLATAQARPASAAACPVILDRVIETAPSGHFATFALTFLGNAPAFAAVDLSARWTHAKTVAHQTPFALDGRSRPFVSTVFTTYDDRTHGSLVDAWVSDVTEKDGTHVACAHPKAMQRRADRVFAGATELAAFDGLSDQSASEKRDELATLSATPAPPSASPSETPAAQSSTPAPPPQACAVPDLPVLLLNDARPQYPDAARQQGVLGTALVLVNVDTQGNNLGERIYKSSGNAILDQAALSAARLSTYQPAIARCYAVPGVFLFRGDFQGN